MNTEMELIRLLKHFQWIPKLKTKVFFFFKKKNNNLKKLFLKNKTKVTL